MKHPVKIVSTGLYIPPKTQTAAELSELIGRSEKWILSRTGVAERHLAEEPMDVIGARAARDALAGGPPPDCILNASATPLQLIPDSSVYIQKELGLEGIPSWSIHSTCLSFIVALLNASSLITTGIYKRILIVSSETGTPWRYMKEPESAALFGDGAAAVVLEATPQGEDSALLDWEMKTWPEGADLTTFPGAGTRRPPNRPDKTRPEDNYFHMKGPAVFRMARNKVKDMIKILFERNQITAGDIDLLVPHQASGRGVASAAEYGFDMDRVMNIVERYGNCIAASMPMALAMADKEGKLIRGQQILLGGTGAGLSVAFALIRW